MMKGVVTWGIKARGSSRDIYRHTGPYPETTGSWSPGGRAGRDFWRGLLRSLGDASSAPKEMTGLAFRRWYMAGVVCNNSKRLGTL